MFVPFWKAFVQSECLCRGGGRRGKPKTEIYAHCTNALSQNCASTYVCDWSFQQLWEVGVTMSTLQMGKQTKRWESQNTNWVLSYFRVYDIFIGGLCQHHQTLSLKSCRVFLKTLLIIAFFKARQGVVGIVLEMGRQREMERRQELTCSYHDRVSVCCIDKPRFGSKANWPLCYRHPPKSPWHN